MSNTATKLRPAPKTKARSVVKSKTTYFHLIIDYLVDGIGAVDRRVAKENVQKATVMRAVKELKETHPDQLPMFEAWAKERFPRGKKAPVAGESRNYKAQKVKDGNPFLRLPLDVLGIGKGDIATVAFDGDVIKVTRKKA